MVFWHFFVKGNLFCIELEIQLSSVAVQLWRFTVDSGGVFLREKLKICDVSNGDLRIREFIIIQRQKVRYEQLFLKIVNQILLSYFDVVNLVF